MRFRKSFQITFKAAQGKTEEFELKSSLLHHIPKYHGLSMEDPNNHLKEFEVVCSIMTPINVDGIILKMKAFPFSFREKAKDWLYELSPGAVTSWESMKRAFLEKFFPTSRVILLRKRISGIQQDEGESFPTYYERFKSLVASCPQHQMKEELLLQYFYEGLLPIERQMLDASAGGALVDKTPTVAKTLIANRALNAQQYEGDGQRSTPRKHQVNEGMQTRDKKVDELEKQVGQIAEFMGQFREQGKLPSSTFVNPKGGFESAKAIMLRSGKEVGKEVPIVINSNVVPPNAPFPRRFMQSKKEEAEKDILETFRKVQVNIPLLDAIKQVPRSNAYPKGVLEDVLVQVNHLIFPADFYVLEMDESDHAPSLPILLGRPFMKMARTKIDVFNGTLTMEFHWEVININLSDSMKYPSENHSCFAIDVIDSMAHDHFDKLKDDVLELVIARGMDMQNMEPATMHTHGMHEVSFAVPPSDGVIEIVAALESLPP
ncbi:unnamed protein product [Malus baccata var. baccata]